MVDVPERQWLAVELHRAKSRFGKYNNKRFDRHMIYRAEALVQLAGYLRQTGVISIENDTYKQSRALVDRMKADFRRRWKQFHTDQ